MAKQSKQIRASRSQENTHLEHTEMFDDNPFPDAHELQKLCDLDSDIPKWIRDRADKEQGFRHSTFSARIKLTDDHNCREHNTTRMALFIYMLLVSASLVFSYQLLMAGKNVQGSIFGGVAVVLAIAVIVTRRNPTAQEIAKAQEVNQKK